MVFPSYAIPGVAIGSDGFLLWRLSRHRQFRRYPYFAAFVSYDLLRTVFAVTVFHFRPSSYATMYWDTEAIALVLLFAIVWEIARNLFPVGSFLRRLAWKTVISTEAMLLPALLLLAWGWSRSDFHEYPVLNVWPVVEQYFTFAIALLLLILSGVARYYGVAFGRNMRGLISGFGVYLSLYAANFAALQIVPRFHIYWQFSSSITYSAMVFSWLWAFWQYAPPPVPEKIRPQHLAQYKQVWEHLWTTTMGLLRHGLN